MFVFQIQHKQFGFHSDHNINISLDMGPIFFCMCLNSLVYVTN